MDQAKIDEFNKKYGFLTAGSFGGQSKTFSQEVKDRQDMAKKFGYDIGNSGLADETTLSKYAAARNDLMAKAKAEYGTGFNDLFSNARRYAQRNENTASIGTPEANARIAALDNNAGPLDTNSPEYKAFIAKHPESAVTSSGGKSPLDLTNQIQNQNQTNPSTYSGPSIVDYLASTGKANDFASRKTLATSLGIQNYTGTAEQNTQLLGMLRGQAGGGTGGTSGGTTGGATGTGGGATGGTTGGVGTSDQARNLTREQEIQRIKDEMAAGAGPAPTPYNSTAEYDKLRREQGVVQDENELNAIQNEQRMAAEQLNQFKQTSTGEISQGGYLGNISEAERNLNFRMESLSLREQAVTQRLNTKNSFISQSLELGRQDYATAKANYEDEYNKNLSAIQTYNNEQSQQKQDAMTSFTTISNLMQAGGMTTISPQLSSQLDTYANQLGIPQGMLQAAIKGSTSRIDNVKTANNSMYMWTTGKDGVPQLKVIKGVSSGSLKVPKGSPSGFSSNDVLEGQQMLNKAKGEDGYTDPNLYKKMYDAWVNNNGSPTAFIKAYPPKAYINPAPQYDPLPAILRTGLPKLDSGSSSSNPY